MTFYREHDFQITDIGKIPKEWSIARLSEIGDVSTGKTPATANSSYWDGDIPFITPADMNEKYVFRTERKITLEATTQTKVLPKNAVMVVCIGSTIGKVALTSRESSTNQQINSIITDSVSPEFLYYSILSRASLLKAMSGIAAVPIVKKSLFEQLKVALPSKLEQSEIARVLGAVDSALELVNRVIAKTERLKKALMKQLITHGIGHTEYKRSTELVSQVPENWDVVRFKDANERIFVGIATSSTKHFASQGVPLLRNQNIKETGVDLSDLVFINRDFADANKSKALKENDIVIVRTGFPGLSSRVTKEMVGWQTFTTLISRPKLSEFDSDFLVYVLNSPICKHQIARLQAGLAQQNLNVGSIVNLYVPKPPKTEQIRIAERIKAIYEKQRLEKESFEKLKRIKQGLMNILLTGKVRIEVD